MKLKKITCSRITNFGFERRDSKVLKIELEKKKTEDGSEGLQWSLEGR